MFNAAESDCSLVNIKYSLLGHNCMDFALSVINRGGINIQWNKDLAVFIASCESTLSINNKILYEILRRALQDSLGPTIPAAVFNEYLGCTGNLFPDTNPRLVNL